MCETPKNVEGREKVRDREREDREGEGEGKGEERGKETGIGRERKREAWREKQLKKPDSGEVSRPRYSLPWLKYCVTVKVNSMIRVERAGSSNVQLQIYAILW